MIYLKVCVKPFVVSFGENTKNVFLINYNCNERKSSFENL